MHLTDQQLADLALGRTESGDIESLRAHVVSCSECADRHVTVSSLVFAKTTVAVASEQAAVESVAANAEPVLEAGTLIGRYVLIEKIGAGSMGEVFTASDPHLDRRVALKLLRSEVLSFEEGHARLLREAQSLARLQHPNVISVHDVGMFHGRVFIAMEHVSGEPLSKWMQSPHSESEVVSVFLQAGAGLAAAHQSGLIHRDFKPDNVHIGHDGRVRVLDFGLARPVDASELAGAARAPKSRDESHLQSQISGAGQSPLTQLGAIVGTPGYMAPEQLAGLAVDARSDQFSYCAALYEALTGARPFAGNTLGTHALEIEQGRFVKAENSRTVSPKTLDIAKRGLQAKPSNRWPSMDALLSALRPKRRRRVRTFLGLLAMAALAVLGVFWAASTTRRLAICGGQDRFLESVWDKDTQARIGQVFDQSGTADAKTGFGQLQKTLNAYALSWTQAMREVCEASKIRKTDGPALAEQKNACLLKRLERFRAFTTMVQKVEAPMLKDVVVAAQELDPVSNCFNASLVDPVSNGGTAQVEDVALEPWFQVAHARLSSGDLVEGQRQLRALEMGKATPQQRSEYMLLDAAFEEKKGASHQAFDALLKAAAMAIEAQDGKRLALALGRLAVNAERVDNASAAQSYLTLAEASARRFPDDVDLQSFLLLQQGTVKMQGRLFQAAKRLFEDALRLERGAAVDTRARQLETLSLLAEASMAVGEYATAQQRLREALALLETQGDVSAFTTTTLVLALSRALRQAGQLSEADGLVSDALQKHEANKGMRTRETQQLALELAWVANARGDRERAMTLATTVAEAARQAGHRTNATAAAIQRAEVYANGGDYREAAQLYAQTLKSDAEQNGAHSVPLSVRALVGLARVSIQQGAWLSAQTTIEQALSLCSADSRRFSSELADVKSVKGLMLSEQQRTELALASFKEAVALREQKGAAEATALVDDWVNIGLTLSALHRSAEAVVVLQRAIKQRPSAENSSNANMALARVLWSMGASEKSRAIELFTVAIKGLTAREQEAARVWARQSGLPVFEPLAPALP